MSFKQKDIHFWSHIFFLFLQLEYKAKYEETKVKSHLPPDYPFFIQSRVNAFNLSDVSILQNTTQFSL